VTGDAGVGKTRLAGEGIARAVAGGLVVVRGECMPLSATLPLLPVAAALGELAELEGGAVMEAGRRTSIAGWCTSLGPRSTCCAGISTPRPGGTGVSG
jgi:hypothetical protein